MNTKSKGATIIFSASLSALILSGCASTETIEPSSIGPADHTITLAVSAPDAFGSSYTRAVDNSLQLRYVAKLYEGNAVDKNKFLQRKELLATDGTIVFTAPKKGEYTVTIFADYIDAGATADSKGCYPDKFYDTSGTTDFVYMRSICSKDGKETYVYNSVNNDNYDCFAGKFSIMKEETVYERNLTLKRAVCKVKIISTDGVPEGVDKIRLTKFSFMNEYNFTQNLSGSRVDISKNKILEFYPSNISGKELFYFYTFGSLQGDGFGPKEIAFEIIAKDGYSYGAVLIPGDSFRPQANYVYNIKGSFLTPTSSPAPPSNEIRLTVNKTDDWEGTHEKKVQ